MNNVEKILAFIDERLEWNQKMMECDPKPSDIGRIEEARCIRRYIKTIVKPSKRKETQHRTEESSVYDGPEGVWDNR